MAPPSLTKNTSGSLGTCLFDYLLTEPNIHFHGAAARIRELVDEKVAMTTPLTKIDRLYLIGSGASSAYGLPTLKTLTWDLCEFLTATDRKILLDAIYECIGIDVRVPGDIVDFEELLDRLDPRALAYLATDKSKEVRPQAAEIALRGLREFMINRCSAVGAKPGPYDRLVASLGKREAIVTFNWDVLLELAFRRNSIPYSYWNDPAGGQTLLKPHGSINWFALLDRELLSIDVKTTNWDVFGHDLQYYLLFLKLSVLETLASPATLLRSRWHEYRR